MSGVINLENAGHRQVFSTFTRVVHVNVTKKYPWAWLSGQRTLVKFFDECELKQENKTLFIALKMF